MFGMITTLEAIMGIAAISALIALPILIISLAIIPRIDYAKSTRNIDTFRARADTLPASFPPTQETAK